MKLLNNYARWINDLWITAILEKEGQARPRDWPPAYAQEVAEYARAKEAGYDLTAVNWWVYEEKDLNIKMFPPWCQGPSHCWFTKMMPGQFMPIHADPHTHDKPCKRYWMPLQDYEAGHVFIYKDQLINNYKKGDLFEFDDPTDIHGAANIGHTPRIMLLVTEYL